MVRKSIVAVLALAASTAAVPAQDIEAGATSYRKCEPCHSIGEGARHKIGPALNGLEGRRAGTIEGYNYTDANKNADLSWTEAAFRDYIRNPAARMPGTKMLFPGVQNQKEIADLWAFLKQFKADGTK